MMTCSLVIQCGLIFLKAPKIQVGQLFVYWYCYFNFFNMLLPA